MLLGFFRETIRVTILELIGKFVAEGRSQARYILVAHTKRKHLCKFLLELNTPHRVSLNELTCDFSSYLHVDIFIILRLFKGLLFGGASRQAC